MSRTTGYQIKVGDERNSFTVPEDGKIVAWSINLGKPTAEQIDYFDKNLGGQASARLTVLRLGRTLYSRTISQSPVQKLEPYFGQTVQFPLGRSLNVKKGYVIALTVPTWAPALTPLLTDHSSWRASRAKGKCDETGRQTAQTVTGRRRAVPLPLQGAAHLQRDARHPPGAHPEGRPRRDVGSLGGVAASLTPAARSGTCGLSCPSRSSSASMTSGSYLEPAPARSS